MNPCGLCGGSLAPLFEKFGHRIALCAACGTASVDPLPSPEDIRKVYTLDYFKGNRSKFGYTDYAAEAACLERGFAARIEAIRSFVPKGRILDVGCANGSFLGAFGPEWDKHGVELSAEFLKDSPPPSDVKVFVGDFLAYPAGPASFDVVTLFDVLDHVRDPKAVLDKAAGLLRPGGLLVVQQGDRDSLFARLLGRRWHIYIPPTHLWYFSKAGLIRLLSERGLKTEREEYEPRWATFTLCLFRLSYILPSFLVDPFYRAVKGTWLGELGVRFNLRDVVTLYAVKS